MASLLPWEIIPGTSVNQVWALCSAHCPLCRYRNDNGTYSDVTPYGFNGIDAENPVALAEESLDRNTTTRFQGGIDLRATIAKGLDQYHPCFGRLLPDPPRSVFSAHPADASDRHRAGRNLATTIKLLYCWKIFSNTRIISHRICHSKPLPV